MKGNFMDLLVKLYDLHVDRNFHQSENIIIRRPIPPEKTIIVNWIKKNFSQSWADECEISFSNKPVSCFIAQIDKNIIGFACYEATMKNFFGPFGILPSYRNQYIGKSLLFHSLLSMKEMGYAYCIIGGAGPIEYYKKFLPVVPISNSIPGIYENMLISDDESFHL